jgi:Family of unknown function (DUF6308)
LTAQRDYVEWRQTWPEMIVRTITDTAADYLQRYYDIYDGGRPRYTGAHFESMAALNSDPNTIGPADFVAVSMLSANVPPQAAIRILGPDSVIIRELLSKIPANVDIVDIPQMLYPDAPASQLWDVLRRGRDGLGPTRTSKLLAAKRPRLLPIWDSFVEQATGLDTIGYWSKFQRVLTADDRRIWRWLGELRSHAPNIPHSIPELRILDVLLWMSVESA